MLTTNVPLARAHGVIYSYDEETCDISLPDGSAGLRLRGLFNGETFDFPKGEVVIVSMTP
jgi:hypothetical protein